jgi:hypothetical protein
VRRSEYTQLAEYVFGPTLADVYHRELVLEGIGHRTPVQALADGENVRRVWTALCDEMQVPESRRWEIPPEARPR